jgi:hypothetical protein
MSERAYDLEAIVAAHRAAKAGGYWVRLSVMIVDRATLERVERKLAWAECFRDRPDMLLAAICEAASLLRGLLAEPQENPSEAHKSDAVHRGDWFRQAWANANGCSVEEAERAYETLGDITVTRRERLRRAGLLAEGEESREP